jgi:non-specific serine/threonine protein kinase
MLRLLWNRIATLFTPDEVLLQPNVDFDAATGNLQITIKGNLSGNTVRLSKRSVTRGNGTFNGRRFQINRYDREEIKRILASCEWTDDWILRCGKDNVPDCLTVLRQKFTLEETPAAKTVSIHPGPLENRTYLDLDDPEALIVRQTLATSDELFIQPPKRSPGEHPSWLRVSDHFFKLPKERLQEPTQGTEVSPGTRRLVKDEVPTFLEKDLPDIKKSGRVLIDKGVSELRVVATPPQVQTSIDLDNKTSQIIVRPQYRSGDESLDHVELLRADQSRQYYRKQKTYHRVDWSQVHRVKTALKDIGLEEQPDGSYRAPSLSYDEIINIFSKLGILSESEVFARFRQRLLDFSKIESLDLPEDLRQSVSVRDYQHHGYEWLAFLKQYGLPGILADEMGLGKTLQALLAIAHFREKYGPCPSLVVCPAGLVEKWADEADKFLSDFSVLTHYGQNRKQALRTEGPHVDLIVTSYETMVRDAPELRLIQWRFLILDEAQRIKNPETQRAKAVRKIPAEARIAITGTPVENKLQDLWSVFDFLAPGFLFSKGEFERRISIPIENRGDKNALDLLLRKTRPFVLRRLKKDVAKELPEKIEKTVRCELTEKQRALYKAVVTRDLEEAIKATGREKLTLGNPHIFAVLMKLKQICCHPGLVTGDFEEFKPGVSGKFDAFMDIIEEILDTEATGQEPNKFVAFSQYVQMATLLQDFIVSKGRSCDRIDGSVPPGDRPALCKQFNSEPSRFGVVSTLFSGGVGLDLQSANYVALYDQWWNPAVHSQAVDRVHRIGQKRTVVVFYILARGTLEDKIEAKLLKKKDLFDLTIRPDEYLRKEVTRDELMDLVKLEN